MDWFDQVPKVELHVHLEGAIPYPALWELIQKYGGAPEIPDMDTLLRKLVYKDFPEFIETWIWKNRFIREYEDFTFIAEQVAIDWVNQNIKYAETFYCPSDFRRIGLNPQQITLAIRQGLSRVPEIEIALIADLCRDDGPEQGAKTLAAVNEVKSLGVIGIGIGGSEQRYPPEPYKPVYEQAREFGFYTSAHAGEAAGADSIWGAIKELKVDRIGHGTRAEEDEQLLDYLAESKIPIELCPISNVRTGVIPSLESHPVRRYFEKGLVITINSDDPKMFGNSVSEEYRELEQCFGFTKPELQTLILQGIHASWLPPEKKLQLTDSFIKNPIWQVGLPNH
ncbi:MAG: adenosine deaminase [bacterium]